VALARGWVGTGLIPLTDITFPEDEPAPMLIAAMLPEPLDAAATEVDVVLFALAQPAINATATHASAPRPAVLRNRLALCI
jgi:hypothetical protein